MKRSNTGLGFSPNQSGDKTAATEGKFLTPPPSSYGQKRPRPNAVQVNRVTSAASSKQSSEPHAQGSLKSGSGTPLIRQGSANST